MKRMGSRESVACVAACRARTWRQRASDRKGPRVAVAMWGKSQSTRKMKHNGSTDVQKTV